MKNWKRFLALALALLMTLGTMASCSKKEEPEVPEATAPVVYDSYYYFYDYGTGEYIRTDVATYQAVTGAVCEMSAIDFSFLEGDYEYVVEGYNKDYGVFVYAYDEDVLTQYRNYLTSRGYLCSSTEQYTEGFSYYFENSANGYMMDIFVADDKSYVAIEPYLNSDPEGGKSDTQIPAETEAPATEAPVTYDPYYYFYDYSSNEYYYSDVSVYQDITGAKALKSMLDWGFLGDDYDMIVDGYNAEYALFMYEYSASQMAKYEKYLESVGYTYEGSESFTEGTSYYYKNSSNGSLIDLFVANGGEYLVIEPCLNRDSESSASEFPEASTFYYFYDYEANEYYYSEVAAYQDITGAKALKSMLDWGFLETGYEMIVDGYNDEYALFMYEYDSAQMAKYEKYLESIGYVYDGSENFTEGTSYYYRNASDGSLIDMFVANGGKYLVIEPGLNRD